MSHWIKQLFPARAVMLYPFTLVLL